jgi:hypothetical protein
MPSDVLWRRRGPLITPSDLHPELSCDPEEMPPSVGAHARKQRPPTEHIIWRPGMLELSHVARVAGAIESPAGRARSSSAPVGRSQTLGDPKRQAKRVLISIEQRVLFAWGLEEVFDAALEEAPRVLGPEGVMKTRRKNLKRPSQPCVVVVGQRRQLRLSDFDLPLALHGFGSSFQLAARRQQLLKGPRSRRAVKQITAQQPPTGEL